ncbi:MAG: glycosyltransferase N-terminal domain-containing protein [Saprospiraceae bacterium]
MMYLFVLGIRISSFWNAKSRLWLRGRKNWYSKIQCLPAGKNSRIWFHVSSLGEFEQARTVIEKIKSDSPHTEIILTFFSPSGYELKKEYTLATTLYLPADLPGNAKKWLQIIKPDLAVFVKYDLWPGYIKALSDLNIPAILFSAHWKQQSGISSWTSPLIKNELKRFKMIFLQRPDLIDFFKKNGFENIAVAGDTRIDRALNLAAEVKSKIPDSISEQRFDIVAGSTWPKDEDILFDVIRTQQLKAIIAPHDISPKNIDRIMEQAKGSAVKLSSLSIQLSATQIIIVDNIGLLSVLYSLGDIAYIGGGFGKGIHNSLEAMAHKKPVIFGPHYQKFPEALDMIESGGAMTINSKQDLYNVLNQFKKPGEAESSGMKCYQYLQDHAGATTIVSEYILKSIPNCG